MAGNSDTSLEDELPGPAIECHYDRNISVSNEEEIVTYNVYINDEKFVLFIRVVHTLPQILDRQVEKTSS